MLTKDKVKEIRLDLSMSQEEFARKVGVSLNSVNRWENGKCKPNKLARKILSRLESKAAKNTEKEMSCETSLTADANNNNRKRILVVDDEPTIVDIITEALMPDNPDYDISAAHDGYEAGRKIVTFKPHLVILDLKMPGLDGFEVCKRIKRDNHNTRIKVIIVTAFPGDGNIEKILSHGADAFMTKPIQIDQLKELVANFLI